MHKELVGTGEEMGKEKEENINRRKIPFVFRGKGKGGEEWSRKINGDTNQPTNQANIVQFAYSIVRNRLRLNFAKV